MFPKLILEASLAALDPDIYKNKRHAPDTVMDCSSHVYRYMFFMYARACAYTYVHVH